MRGGRAKALIGREVHFPRTLLRPLGWSSSAQSPYQAGLPTDSPIVLVVQPPRPHAGSSTSSAAVIFCLQQALSFRYLCRQGVALASTRQLRSQSPVSVQAYRTERVTGSEEKEGANGIGGGIGVGGGNGDGDGVGGGNGDVNGHDVGDGAGAGAGTGTGVEVNEGAQDGNGDGSWDGAGTGTRTGVETRRQTPDENGNGNGDRSEDSSEDGNGNEDSVNRNEDRIGEGGRKAKKRKKPQNSCRRHVRNGETWVGKDNM